MPCLSFMPRKEIYTVAFFAVLMLVLYGIGRLLAPFGGALLSAFVLALTFYPFYQWLGRRLPKVNRSFRAFLADFLVLIFFVVPIGLLIWMVVSESEGLNAVLRRGGETLSQVRQGNFSETVPWLGRMRSWLSTLGVSPAQFQQNLIGRIGRTLGAISMLGADLAQHVLVLAF